MLLDAYGMTFYEFDDEKDLEEYGVWLCDVVHGRPPMKPTYLAIGWYWYHHANRNGAQTLCLPSTHGWDGRFVDGYPYITCILTTPEEAKAREPMFKEQIRPFLEDFDSVWEPMKADMLKTYRDAKESRGLKEWGDIKKLRNHELLKFFLDYVYIINRKEAETHFIMLHAAFYISGMFQDVWHTTFDTEPSIDPRFHALMSGFESMDITFTRELWKLGRKAVDQGFGQLFKDNDDALVLEELKESEAGRQWSADYHEFLLEHGWRADRMHAYDYPTWIEKPEIGLARIKFMMAEEVFPFDANRERANRERQKAESEILDKVPEHQREAFKLLMKGAQKAAYWSEDHGYYLDFYVSAMGRWILTEFGRRFAEAGCIDDPGDIHYLYPDEIRKAAVPMGRVNLRHYVEPRKNKHEENLKIEPAPFLGDIGKAQLVLRSDPALSVSTQLPIVREKLKADLYGASGAPGVVEGVARVIMRHEDLFQVQPGEILVAPGTSAAWTVVFSVIKGLVSDGGGFLSHPVIMAREFGMPCVSGCVEGTQKIKTGQRVRVDGNQGVVYILDK